MAIRSCSWSWACSAVLSLACANDDAHEASTPRDAGSGGSSGVSGSSSGGRGGGMVMPMSAGGSPPSGGAPFGGAVSGGTGGTPFGGAVSGGTGGTMMSAGGHIGDAGDVGPDADASADAAPVDASSCYSPGQNLEHVREPGAVGCPCADPAASLCKATWSYRGAGGSSGSPAPIGLLCDRGRWKAVEGGPCDDCWSPETPDLAEATGFKNGCACSPDQTDICVGTGMGEYVDCRGGRYVDGRIAERLCPCSVDAQCGYGNRCVNRQCSQTACVVYGVYYAPGVGGIPDPASCNTCTCNADGTLTCTEKKCPLSH